MPMRAGVQRGLLFPFPKTTEERELRKQAFLDSRANKGKMHYFVKEDGSIHYFDNKGNGEYRFNDLANKLHNEASRRARKLEATPTLEDYVAVFGDVNGPNLFQAEQERLREIYKNADTVINDVDHIDSLGQGGLHYSRNLRELLRSENRSDGQRRITDEMRNALLLAQDKRDQIALQGPDVPIELRNLQALANVMRPAVVNGFHGALDIAASIGGRPVEAAVDVFYGAVDNPVRQAIGEGVFDQIPNGTPEQRQAKNNKVNSSLQQNSKSNGNGVAHAITNELAYLAKVVSNKLEGPPSGQ